MVCCIIEAGTMTRTLDAIENVRPGGFLGRVIPRLTLVAAASWVCLLRVPCWSAEGVAEGESRLSSKDASARDFETTLEKLTSLSANEVRKLRLQFGGDSAAEQRPALDALLQKVRTLSPEAVAQLRLALLNPDASVRWMSIQILARQGDAPLLLFARLLRDDSKEVQLAAEQALVAAGHAAIPLLVRVVAEEPCYSRAKVAATRALGTLGDPCGIEVVAEALIKNQSGCYDHETAFKALRQMGPPAIETLVALLKYRLLKGRAYLVLLEHEPAAVKSALVPVIADSDRAIDDRLHFAEQAEILLGTMPIFRDLDAFYLGLIGDKSSPPEVVETAQRIWVDRAPRHFVVEALTRERAASDFAAERFIEEDETEARMAQSKRRAEIAAVREAKAEVARRAVEPPANGTSSLATSFRSGWRSSSGRAWGVA
jgi:hypothetical protein